MRKRKKIRIIDGKSYRRNEGFFKTEKEANELAKSFEKKGYNTKVLDGKESNKKIYLVYRRKN